MCLLLHSRLKKETSLIFRESLESLQAMHMDGYALSNHVFNIDNRNRDENIVYFGLLNGLFCIKNVFVPFRLLSTC